MLRRALLLIALFATAPAFAQTRGLQINTVTNRIIGAPTVKIPSGMTLEVESGGVLKASALTNGSAVLTLPTVTDDILGRTGTATITGKSISGSNNTLTNIPLGSVSGTLSTGNGGTSQVSWPIVRAHAHNSTGQTVTSSTWTKMAWANEDEDTAGAFASGTYTCPRNGMIEITGTIAWQQFSPASQSAVAAIYKNGVEVVRATGTYANNLEQPQSAIAVKIPVTLADTIEVWVFQNSGVNQLLEVAYFNQIQITYVLR